ncbi:MAG: MOSC domain-containing protein [Nitrospinota bacterium]
MKLLSVNVSGPRSAVHRGRVIRTGIFKTPVQGRVMIRTLNIEGDAQADLTNHGGIHKAVYAYAAENYEYWKKELRREDLAPGQFGENLTAEGMTEEAVCIGDIFRIGGAVAEVSQPRNPCYKLGIKMGSQAFVQRFLESGRLGIYMRVLEEGEIGAGDPIERIEPGPEGISVLELARLQNFGEDDLETARRALRIPALAPEIRQALERRLEKAGLPPGEAQ